MSATVQLFSLPSKHACFRIAQRTNLTWSEVAYILDRHLFVLVGNKPGVWQKTFLVFYSEKDDTCFVVIQNRNSGRVCTVLPMRWYQKWIPASVFVKAKRIFELAKEEDQKAEIEAREKAQNEALEKAHQLALKQAEEDAKKVFEVRLRYRDSAGHPYVKTLLTIPSVPYNNSVSALLQDSKFSELAEKHAQALAIATSQITGLIVNCNVSHQSTFIELQ